MPENLIRRFCVLISTDESGYEYVFNEWADPSQHQMQTIRESALDHVEETKRVVRLVEFTRGCELTRFEPSTEDTKI